jgi:hypothetical protein
MSSIISVEKKAKQEKNKQSPHYTLLHAGFLFDLFFNPEIWNEMFLRNVV